MDWGLTDEENRENAAVLDKHLQKLLDLPIDEVERATGLKPENMIQNVEILERRRITSEIEVEDGIPSCKLYPDFESGWSYWNDIREFVKKNGTPIERICCDLDFSVFDE